jgi:hypothetical protein
MSERNRPTQTVNVTENSDGTWHVSVTSNSGRSGVSTSNNVGDFDTWVQMTHWVNRHSARMTRRGWVVFVE